MSMVAGMLVRIGADISNFVQGMDRMKEELDNSIGKAAETSKKMAIGLGIASAAVGALGVKSVMMAGQLEQSKVAFTTMLGSAQQADIFLRQLQSFAAKTPFELNGLQDSSKKLLAFGFQANDIIPMMTGIGNAISGLGGGAEELNRVTMALGQMKAKGKVSAEEMMQLAEIGIPAWDMLAKKIGKSVPEAMKLAEKGAIQSDTAIAGIIAGMNARFPNMMEKQTKTLLGAWSNLQDGISRTLTLIGGVIVAKLSLGTVIANMANALSGFADAIQSSGLQGAIDTIFSPAAQYAIVAIAGAITTSLIPALLSAGGAFLASQAPMIPWYAAGLAIGTLAFVIAKNWKPISGFFIGIFNAIGGALNSVVGAFGKGFSFIANIVGSVANWIREKLAFLWSLLPQAAKDALGKVGMSFSSGLGAVGAKASSVFSVVGSGILNLGSSAISVFQTIPAKALPALQELATKTTAHTGKAAGAVSAAAVKAAKEAKKSADAITDAYKKSGESIYAIGLKAKYMGDDFNAAAEKANAVKSAIQTMAENGAKEGSARMVELTQKLKTFTEQAKAFEISKITKDMNQGLAMVAKQAGIMGDNFSVAAESAKLMEAALTKLRDKGVAPTVAQLAKLADFKLAALDFESNKAMKGIKLKKGFFGDAFNEDAANADRLLTKINSTLNLGKTPSKDLMKQYQAANLGGMTFDFNAKMAGIKAEGALFGTSTTEDEISAVGEQMKKLVAEGISPQSKAVQDLKTQYDSLDGRIETIPGKFGAIGDSLKKALEGAQDVAGVFGVTLPQGLMASLGDIQTVGKGIGDMGQGISGIMTASVSLIGPISTLGTMIGTGLMGAFSAVGTFVMTTIVPMFATLGGMIMTTLAPAFAWLGGVIMGSVVPTLWAMAVALWANPLTWVVVGVVAAIAALGLLARNWDAVMGFLSGVWDGFVKGLAVAWDFIAQLPKKAFDLWVSLMMAKINLIVSAFKLMGTIIVKVWEGVVWAISSLWSGIVTVFKAILNPLIEGVNLLLDGLSLLIKFSPAGTIAGAFGASVSIPHIPKLATGGVATNPTTAVIGDGGTSEAVLPLNEATFERIGQAIARSLIASGYNGRQGSGDTFNISIPVQAFMGKESDAEAFAKMIGIKLREMKLRMA